MYDTDTDTGLNIHRILTLTFDSLRPLTVTVSQSVTGDWLWHRTRYVHRKYLHWHL